MRFIDLPKRRAVNFELAVVVDEETERTLRDNGWSLVALATHLQEM